MRVVYAFLADTATGTPGGKADATGIGFDTIFAEAFPAMHAHMALVCRLEVAITECDVPHELRIEMLGPDGQLMFRQVAQFTTRRVDPTVVRPPTFPLILDLVNLPFPAAGDYAFHLLVDNIELAVVPLYIQQGQPPVTAEERPDGNPPTAP